MHEGAIAESIVDILKQTKEKNGLEKITKVTLKIGIMSGVMVDALLFALDAIKNEETFIKNAVFEVENVNVKAYCVICGKHYSYERNDELTLMCKDCSMPLEIIEGKEMEIVEIEGE